MEFTEKDLEHIERLARVKLGGESREKLREQLSRIIEFVRRLEAVDAPEDGSRGGRDGAPLRADEPRPCLPREEILAEAPGKRDVFFEVPPVIETEDG